MRGALASVLAAALATAACAWTPPPGVTGGTVAPTAQARSRGLSNRHVQRMARKRRNQARHRRALKKAR